MHVVLSHWAVSPEKMCEIMRADVLTGSIELADPASRP
jgi:hypothetical protein